MCKINFQNAEFLNSASKLQQMPEDSGGEIAFIGRSNAGKSSVLNAICSHGRLAKTSKTPGRTQLLNSFGVGENLRLIDLPGYGFAKVAKKTQQEWEVMLRNYFSNRESLLGLVIVMDIRHYLKPGDEQMLEWGLDNRLNVHLLLNKADKLSKSAQNKALNSVNNYLDSNDFVSYQAFSATKKQGVQDLRELLKVWFGV